MFILLLFWTIVTCMFIEWTITSQDCYTENKTKTFTDMDLDIMTSVFSL
jgi:hypothetical protein